MKILLTAIGGDISQSIAKLLKHADPSVHLIGTDTNTENAGKFYVDKFLTIPFADAPSYLSTMKFIIEKYNVDCVIPINENEILKFHQHIANNEYEHSNKIIIAQTDGFQNFFDKYKTIRFLKNLLPSIGLPWTTYSDVPPKNFPCIYKPLNSSGSRGLKIISLKDYERYGYRLEKGIFQELLYPSSEEYTCGVYRNKSETQIITLHRQLKGGLTGYAEVVYDEDIFNYCKIIADAIQLNGSINIQLIKTETGPKLFEINPRFSSTVIFRHYMHFTDVMWSINDKLFKKCETNFVVKKVIGKKFYRVYSEIIE